MKFTKQHIVNIAMIASIIGESEKHFTYIRSNVMGNMLDIFNLIGLIAYDIGLEEFEINKNNDLDWYEYIDSINSANPDAKLRDWQDWVLWRTVKIFDENYKGHY